MNILVSNLSIDVISNDLHDLFSVYGEVSYIAIVRNKKSGRSMGTAFIEMPQEAQAVQAIMALNQKKLDGKKNDRAGNPIQARGV